MISHRNVDFTSNGNYFKTGLVGIIVHAIHSTLCSAEITFKTDPKNTDYLAEHGASRNFEPWREERVADEVPMVICVTSRQISDLLNTTEVKSADYNTVKALAAGQIDTFCGFKFVKIKRLPLASQLRTCVAWAKGSIKVTRGAKKTSIAIREDLSRATQIYSEWHLGGTRVHDEAVVTIDCKEV